MKNRKLIIWLTVAIVVIAIVIFVMARKAKAAETSAVIPGTATGDEPLNNSGSGSATGTNTGTSGQSSSTTNTLGQIVGSWYNWIVGTGEKPTGTVYSDAYNSAVFPLKYGSRGEEVKNLQRWLNDHVIIPYALLTIDGIWGNNTDAAVRRTLNVTEVTEAWYKLNILKISI